jgi:hypothetical protein
MLCRPGQLFRDCGRSGFFKRNGQTTPKRLRDNSMIRHMRDKSLQTVYLRNGYTEVTVETEFARSSPWTPPISGWSPKESSSRPTGVHRKTPRMVVTLDCYITACTIESKETHGLDPEGSCILAYLVHLPVHLPVLFHRRASRGQMLSVVKELGRVERAVAPIIWVAGISTPV